MPDYTIYQVDAFAAKAFEGNPAAIVPLDAWIDEETMQEIAMENNLSETAFYVPQPESKQSGEYGLRWFTPSKEVDLCGHATLATAFIIFRHDPSLQTLTFHTRSGELIVTKSETVMKMNFPADPPVVVTDPAMVEKVEAALGETIVSLHKGTTDYLAIVAEEEVVRDLKPVLSSVAQLDARGIIVSSTAKEEDLDFVSRCFYPAYGIDEDPFTGSAHCVLGCYWLQKLNKLQLQAKQISKRSGRALVELKDNRIEISGTAILFMEGKMFVP